MWKGCVPRIVVNIVLDSISVYSPKWKVSASLEFRRNLLKLHFGKIENHIYLYIEKQNKNIDLIHFGKTFWNFVLGKYKKWKEYMYKN